MRTLVYHAGALGDFIAILPTLSRWRRHDPRGTVVLLGKPAFGRLCAPEKLFDETWDVESREWTAVVGRQGDKKALDALRQFDAALVFAANDSPILNNLHAARVRTVLHQPPFPPHPQHIVDYHLSLLDNVCGPARDTLPRLRPDAAAAERARDVVPEPNGAVAIHPGSGSARKNWPIERFAELAHRLESRALHSVWILGPAEHDTRPPEGALVLCEVPLEVLVHVLHSSILFVGNDSGIAHLAASTGCPTVALFQASDPRVWAPRGRHVRVVAGKTDCSPCHPSPVRPGECDLKCRKAIAVDDVFAACMQLVR